MQKHQLVIQTAFIGDLFLSIPALMHIRNRFPEDKIILVCKKGLKDFFLKTGLVDMAFEVDKGHAESYNKAARQINQFYIENLFCFHQSVRSTLFSFKIKARNKIGFSRSFFANLWKKTVFNQLVKYPKTWPDVIRQMSLLGPADKNLSAYIHSKDWSYLNFKDKSGQFPQIPEFFKFPKLNLDACVLNSKKRVAIFPGSVWATKKWTHIGFSSLAEQLVRAGFEVSLMGGPNDVKDSQSILFELDKTATKVTDLTGVTSLLDSSLSLQGFDLIVCNDSAPAHIAASLQRPVLAVFGPTVLDFGFRPWDDHSQVIQIEEMKCRPCGPHGHIKCPLGHHDCMKNIKVKTVFDACIKILKG